MSHNDLQKEHCKAHDAQYALAVFLSIFASVENKGPLGYIPRLEVVGSSPIARSIFAQYFFHNQFSQELKEGSLEPSPDPRHWDSHF